MENEQVLEDAAKEANLPVSALIRFLETTDGAAAVEAEITALKKDGIQVVPSFILNGEHVVVGAQPMKNFQRYFEKLINRS